VVLFRQCDASHHLFSVAPLALPAGGSFVPPFLHPVEVPVVQSDFFLFSPPLTTPQPRYWYNWLIEPARPPQGFCQDGGRGRISSLLPSTRKPGYRLLIFLFPPRARFSSCTRGKLAIHTFFYSGRKFEPDLCPKPEGYYTIRICFFSFPGESLFSFFLLS